jgi:hypothetical protein
LTNSGIFDRLSVTRVAKEIYFPLLIKACAYAELLSHLAQTLLNVNVSKKLREGAR